jgi:hypothetical protein
VASFFDDGDEPPERNERSFLERRKEEQGEFESLLLGPSDAKNDETFPPELVEPACELLEALNTSNTRYEILRGRMRGRDEAELIEMVKEGNIVLYAPSDEEGSVFQYMPVWEEGSDTPVVTKKKIIDFSLKENSMQQVKYSEKILNSKNKYRCCKPGCSFGSGGKSSNEVSKHFKKEHEEDIGKNKKNERLFKKTPFKDRLVCFAEPIEGNEVFKFIHIFQHPSSTSNHWSFLPEMTNKSHWYTNMAGKIGFPRLIKMCLFAIIEKSTKEEWNARAVDSCLVAGIAIRSDLGYDKSNIALSKDDESDRKPENCAWNIFHILRLVGTVDFDKPRYQKLDGSKTKPTLGISFVMDKWTETTLESMLTIRERYSRMASKFMLCPPERHISKTNPGGARRSHLRRIFLRKQKATWAEPSNEDDYPIKALNIVQETIWCINERILKYAKKYIGTHEKDDNGNQFFQPSEKFKEWANWDPDEDILPWHDKAALDWADKLNSRSDGSRFWLAWCFDWRGRMYSATNVLSPQGNDLSRALIQFYHYMPVPAIDIDTKTGEPTALYWLKVNIVEMFNGVELENGSKAQKRSSFDERVEWVNDNSKELLKIAANPDDYVKYWWDSDCRGINAGATTFRRLAALFDYADVCKEINKNGTPISRLPIQQDASSNWLQHTATMLKDVTLANLSNISGGGRDEVPTDIYTQITEQLQVYWEEKEGTNHPFINIFLEPIVNKKLRRRNVAKKPVMAVAYGGDPKSAGKEFMSKAGTTDFDKEIGQHFSLNGMVHDISKELRKINGEVLLEDDHQKFVDQLMKDYKKALYIVAPNHDGVKKRTRELQENKPPKRNRTVKNSALQWTTPAGFFVTNQKGKPSKYPPSLTVWGKLKSTYYWNATTKIHPIDMNKFDTGDSLRGAPPNFIHSIDASHMQMTVVRFSKQEENIPALSMIHDSFGCHAANINKLREAVLESFKDVHKTIPLDSLEKTNRVDCQDFKKGEKVQVTTWNDPETGTIAETPKLDATEVLVNIDALPGDFAIPYPRTEIEFLANSLANDGSSEFDNFIEEIGLKDASYIIG